MKKRPTMVVAFDLLAGTATVMTAEWEITLEGFTIFEEIVSLGHFLKHGRT